MIDRRNIANLYPLSPLQEGMLYHALREPQSRAYLEQIDFELPGELDDAAYLQAWQDLVDRHDILRTLFAVRKLPQPLQIVLRKAPLAVVHEDLSGLSGEDAGKRIAAYREQDLSQGFDLTAAVPMRLALFTLAGRRRVVWSFHHILLDGWSLAILQADLDALYAARKNGTRASLPPAAPFSAYIKWLGQRDRKEGASFWQSRLQGLDMPTPIPRRLDARFLHELPPYTVGEVRHALNPDAARALPALASQHGVTVNIVVQALWGMLLARMNGRQDAAFAATVSGRPDGLEDAGRTVGIFINAVPVRVRLRDDESFSALLQHLHAESIEAQAFHDCPLPEIQAGHPLRDALFDHILVFENYPQFDKPAQPHAPDAVSLHEYTHYNVEFQFLPGDPPVLRFRFHQGLYDESAIAAIAADFDRLLVEAAADPQRPASQLALPARQWKAPASLAIAASFTAEPVAQALAWWLAQFATPTAVQLAPYNQCLQQLGAPDSVLNGADAGVLLFRFADAARDLASMDSAEAKSRLGAQYDMLLALVKARAGKPLLVALLPSAPSGVLANHVRTLEQRWCEAVQSITGIALLDMRSLAARHGLDEVFDAVSDRIGHLPFSPQAFDAIAAEVARAVMVRSRPPFKVIAVDCDNTLWNGVVGEVGTLGVRIDDGHRDLQRFLLERQQEGFLIALASKNREEDVWAVFEQHPDMLLRREHIAAAAINWQPKSGNLRQLAKALDLGGDSVIFIDDSPVECSEVMENCPEALAIPLPADAASYGPWLSRIWAFDLAAVTAEDRERTGMMLAESRRQAALGDAAPEDFLQQLQLKVKFGPVQPHQLARVAQLTQRTNQFNLSGKRRDEAAMAALLADEGMDLFAVEVEDRFGAYGLTGVVIASAAGDALRIDTLLLSCRVLGRKVEQVILAALARRARERGLRKIEAPLVITDRNEPVQQFLRGAPWTAGEESLHSCAADDVPHTVEGIELLDNHVFPAPAPVHHADAPAAEAPHAPVPHATNRHGFPAFPLPIRNEARLAHGLQYLPLLAACAGWPRKRLTVGAPIALPVRHGRHPNEGTEESIAAVWSEVLGREIIDAEASFTELGGHSLHAVRAVSRLERMFNRDIGLPDFFRLNSIAALAAWIDSDAVPARTALPAIPQADNTTDYPLSHNQQRLWILSRMGAAANAYNLCASYRLTGEADLAALRRAVHRVVARHDALRTVIRVRGDEPRQSMLPVDEKSFAVFSGSAGKTEAEIRAHIADTARAPFDLETGPLFRVEVHASDAGRHVLAFYLHHLVGDGWSFGLLLDELARAYAIETGVAPEGDAPKALRYGDYAAWSRTENCEAELAASRDYWRNALQPLDPIARIPTDYPRPAEPCFNGASVMRALPHSLSALQRWCAGHNTTLFPLLSAAVATMLYRCGSERIVRLGMPVAGRNRPELENTIGFFANTVVLSAGMQADSPFAALLAQLHENLTGALEHQSYPFDRVVADLQPEREPGRHPLFDTMVVLQNARANAASLPGMTVEDFPVETGLAAFDLVFEFGETGKDSLACALRYRTDLYRPDTAGRLLDRLMTLLDAALDAPSTALEDLPLIGPVERAQLDAFANGGQWAVPDLSLPELFARQAALTPHAPALHAGIDRMDFRTLDRRANALAWTLQREHSISPGDVVGVMLERTADWPIAMLGVMKAGAVYLPLDMQNPPKRLRELVLRSRAAAVIASGGEQPGFGNIRLVKPLPIDAEETTAPRLALQGSSPAYLLFTSGSTGTPKGVLVQHRAFANMILAQVRGFGIVPDDVVLQIASCAFDASLSELFMGWLAGAEVAIATHEATRDSGLFAGAIRRHRATVATVTPSHLRQLDDADLRGLRKVILAAEAVVGRDVRRLQAIGIACFNAYGPTETAVCATLGKAAAAPDDAAPVPIGRPLANLELRIVDARRKDTPLGVPGELVVLGEGVALGYLDAPHSGDSPFFEEMNGARAVRGYRTGDIGRWLPDGNIEYLGRKDTQVKIRGHRIEPGEVSAALARVAGIRHAEVTVEHGAAGAYLVAWLCGTVMPDATLRAHLAARLPSHMIPAHFHWIERMPLTTSGKFDRAALPPVPPASPAFDDAGLNDLERAILDIWRELLPGTVHAESDFFAAGGNSLLAMGVARRITRQLGHPCAALQFFQTPTVRLLAAALAMQNSDMLVRPLGNGSHPIFALPPHPGLDFGYASLAKALPEATLHAAQFTDRPVPDLIDRYAEVCESLDRDSILLGYSAGGKLALGLAHAMERRGRPVRAVVMIDTWRWTEAAPGIRERIDREMALVPGAQHDPNLAAAYRARLAAFEPRGAVTAPVHHLLAADTAPLPNVTRDWRALALGDYHEHPLDGSHHQLLDERHAPQAAECLRAVMR